MSKKWVYFIAVLMLIVIRVGVLNTNYDQWLLAMGYESSSQFITVLKSSETFREYIGSWALPVFVVVVILYWLSNQDETMIRTHFYSLPVAYVPFSIIGTTLANASFEVSYLIAQPLIILTFGYFYILIWAALIWVFEKLRLVS